jgi:hypothetical protein
VYFFLFGILYREKSGNPAADLRNAEGQKFQAKDDVAHCVENKVRKEAETFHLKCKKNEELLLKKSKEAS